MNNELIKRIDQEIQNLIGQRDTIERLLPNNAAVRELTQIIKVLKDCKAALSEPVESSQDVEWMAGHARVPVEPLAMNETKSIREILFRGWPGCSNHGCIVRGEQQGMATNGQCKCLVDASRTQLHMLQGRLSAVIRAQEPHNE